MLLKEQQSYRKGIIESTLLNIFSKGVGFFNSILLIYLFGTNFKTDLYFLVIAAVGFIASFLLGVVSSVIIPEAMRIRHQDGEDAGQGYINFFFWSFLAISFLFVLIICFAAPFFYSLFSKYSVAELSPNRDFLLLSAILFPLNFMTNFLIFVMSSYKYFSAPMLASLINSCISIFFLIALKDVFGFTVTILAVAAGAMINLIWLFLYMKKKIRWNFFLFRKPSRKNWYNIFLMELNIIPVSFRSFVNIYLLSGLGAGVLTSYNYGMQIALIPEMMIITQVAAVTGIKLNELSAQNNLDAINALFFRIMKPLFFIMLPLAITIFLLSEEIVDVLLMFKKDETVSLNNTIAAFMACFAVTLPARALDIIISNIVIAQQKIRQAVGAAIFLHLSSISLTIIAVLIYGLYGFFVVIPLIYVIFMPVFYFYFTKKTIPFVHLAAWFRQSTIYFSGLLCAGVGLFFLKRYLLSSLEAISNIIIIFFLMACIVIGINKFIRYQSYTFKEKFS